MPPDFECFGCGHIRSHHHADPRDSRGSSLPIGEGRWTVCSGEFYFSQGCDCRVYMRGGAEIRHDKAVREESVVS
jgi:hypothetical protein